MNRRARPQSRSTFRGDDFRLISRPQGQARLQVQSRAGP